MPGKAEHIGVTPDGRQVVRALCSVELSESTDAQKIHIFPAGPVVVARDDRMYQVKDLNAVVSASELPALVDWEHDSEKWDGSTEAAGWVTSLEVSDGSDNRAAGLWGTVEWTPRGKADVQSRAYRYLSPVIIFDRESLTLLQVVSVALTNKPALRMSEIGKFREQLSARFGLQTTDSQRESTMDDKTRKALCSSLGIATDASDEALTSAVNKAAANTALLSQQSTQLAEAKRKSDELEAQLATSRAAAEKAAFSQKVDAMFQENVKKISAAQAKGLREMFSQNPATFDSFVQYQLPTMPEIGNDAPPSAPPSTETQSLSEQTKVPVEVRAKLRKRGMTDERIDAAYTDMQTSRAKYAAAGRED